MKDTITMEIRNTYQGSMMMQSVYSSLRYFCNPISIDAPNTMWPSFYDRDSLYGREASAGRLGSESILST